MSARDELLEALTDGGWRVTPDEAERANRLIDNFAHELAEKIRDDAEVIITAVEREFPYLDGDEACKGVHGAADLIDPEAKP
ncbi:hypothetical protein ACWC0A_37670 [Streptomyces scopuliridis]